MSIEADPMMTHHAENEISATEQATESSISEAASPPTTPLLERTMTKEEAMITQALSKVKKNSKAIEKNNRLLHQVIVSLKNAEKENQQHARQMAKENKKLLSLITQLQKQVSKIKSSATKPKVATKLKKGANKGKAKARVKRR